MRSKREVLGSHGAAATPPLAIHTFIKAGLKTETEQTHGGGVTGTAPEPIIPLQPARRDASSLV